MTGSINPGVDRWRRLRQTDWTFGFLLTGTVLCGLVVLAWLTVLPTIGLLWLVGWLH